MKETLILLTSSYPFGKGETFLETELAYLASSFSRIIILPTKNIENKDSRPIPNNCIVNTSLILKKNKENGIQRVVSKTVLSLKSAFFYKELFRIFPNKISISVLENLFTHSRDAVLIKQAITQTLSSENRAIEKFVIYSYWCSGITFGATLVNSKVPVFSRVHRADLYEELYPKNYIPYRELTFSKINAVISISEDGLKYLTDKYPKCKNKFKLSRLGIPIPKTIQSAEINDGDAIIVASCSNINSNKRVDSIARSLKAFALAYPKTSLIWHHFGSGSMLNKISDIINKFPLNLNAVLHGHIENKALIEWYSNNEAHLFINLSKSEGIPVSIMEANSFGIPAIATNVGGTSELVSKTSGWLLDQHFTDDEILRVLEEALLNEHLRLKKSKAARKTCLIYFDAEKNYPEFIEKIKSL